jgi:dTDP-4-dehydrorhamnose reductase
MDGQLGWELCRALSAIGDVTAVDHSALDLSESGQIRALVRACRPSLIVNAAAYTAVDRAETEVAMAMQVNGAAPGVLAEEAGRVGGALVHYSTDYVFDGCKNSPYVEDDEPRPVSVYGKSKLAGEQAIQATDTPNLILRTSWVYGARGSNFLLTMLRLAKQREELRIVGDQVGAPTWCRAIAEATVRILSRTGVAGNLRETSGIYHMSAAGRTSWHGFASAIVDGASRHPGGCLRGCIPPRIVSIATADYPVAARRPALSLLDNKKLADTFGVRLADWADSLNVCMDEMFSAETAVDRQIS